MTKIALPLGSDIITKEWQLPQKEYIKNKKINILKLNIKYIIF